MRKIDVSLLLPSMEGVGGVERVVVNLSNGLSDAGLNVEIVSAQSEGPFAERVSKDIDIREISNTGFDLLGTPGMLSGLVKYFNNNNPTTTISLMNHMNVPVALAHKISRSNSKLILSEHNDPQLLISDRNPRKWENRSVYAASKFIYPHADEIVAVSHGVATNLESVTRIASEDIHVIYNPVVDDILREEAKKTPDEPWFENNTPTVLAAKPEAQKNLTLFIRAIAEVRQTRDIQAVIVGKGEEREKLENLAVELGIEANVKFKGYVKNIYSYMSSASVFCLSSHWEGLPTILIEALACGCPVVSTDCPSGPSEVLAGGEYGTLVPVNDPSALADGIIQTVDDPPPSAKLQSRANDFSVEQAVMEYRQLFN
jgi:glycosyltransferase involved in cell wall biosynthesis